jgi:multiple sugar transport system substrate-binding protein
MTRRIERRTLLGTLAAALAAPALAAPAVRKKVTLNYWTYADNPNHTQRLVTSVDAYNKSQGFITVQLDANMQTMQVHEKVVVAYAAGAAPDIAGVVQTTVQEYWNNGLAAPIDDWFKDWEVRSDYPPNIIEAMHSRAGQPLIYLAGHILPYVLYYRVDMFEAAKVAPPASYDEFIAAAKAMAKWPDHAGYALRGGDYFGLQVIEPIWGSAGVDFVDAKGNVDFNGPAAVDVIDKWIGMFTRDKSAQPTAVSDRYSELFALMERSKAAMWIYGTHANPQLDAALGSRIQLAPTPMVGKRRVQMAIPGGNVMISSCKEKDAAWDFMAAFAGGDGARSIGPGRGYLPVRTSVMQEPIVTGNRFLTAAAKYADMWWHPPFESDNWLNYQDRIGPYWQQALRQELTPQQYQDVAAKLLRGEG